jgi:hypothetical protein
MVQGDMVQHQKWDVETSRPSVTLNMLEELAAQIGGAIGQKF